MQQGWGSQQSGSGMGSAQGRFGSVSGSTLSGQMGAGLDSPAFSARGGSTRHMRRGPKGYERSDERLKEDISERMYAHEAIDCSEITVDVSRGVVTLDGSVSDRYSKYMIEEMVDAVPGVKDVNNKLRVSRGEDRQSASSQGSYGSVSGSSGSSGASSTGSSSSIGSSTSGSKSSGGESSSASSGGKRSSSSE